MADKKTFTVGFDIADRFTAKFDAITKKIDQLTNITRKIELQLDQGSVSKIEASTARINRAVEKSTGAFGSQKRALDQAGVGFRSLADSMDRASGSHSRLGGLLDRLKGQFSGLMNVADDFGDMTSSLARGDLLGAGRAGGSLMGNAGKGLAAATGLSTGALLVGGGVLAAGAITLPGAATWEKQVGRASKTALGEGYSQRDLASEMLTGYMDLKGVNQEDFVAAVGGAGSLGYMNDEAIQAATLGSKAGAAFDIQTSEAMRMLGVVNQMWAEQTEAIGGNIIMMEKAGSAVNVLGNKYNSTEANILQFLSEAGGLAKVWDMDVAETAAVGSLLETVNIKASEGETMFRSALNAGIFQKKALAPDLEKSLKKAGVRPKGEMGYDIGAALLGISGKDYQEKLNENMADTMLATVDAILEKSGGDSTLAQQMSEAVFGSYGQGFLRLGGQRANLATMTEEAQKGFASGKSLDEEYTRQTSNLIDTFDQSTKIIGALGKVIGAVFIPPLVILLTVFNALTGPVVKLALFLETMLFKQIEKIVGKFQGTQLGQDLAKAFSAITDTAGKIWEVIGPILVKLLELVLDVLSGPIMGVLWLIAAIYDKIRPYVLTIVDALLVVIDKLKGMWNWLMDAIPGARKEEARKALVKQAEREKFRVTPAGSLDRMTDSDGHYLGEINPSDKLLALQEKYQSLPGFAEGIADAVKAGLSSVADSIAERIAEALPEFPSFDSLTKALEDLPLKIKDAILGNDFVYQTAKYNGQTYIEGADPEGNKTYWKQREFWGIDSLVPDAVITEDDLPQEVKDQWGIGHAAGLTFTKGGVYAARFHGPEELLGQAETIRGPGIIARAMDALDGAARSASGASRVQPISVTVNPTVKADFAGARFSSDIDIKRMLDMMSTKMESVATTAVERAIGQGRT